MRLPLFFLVILALAAAVSLYVHRRAAAAFGLSPTARRALAIALAAGVLAMPLGRLLRAALPAAALRALIQVGSLVMLSLLIAAAVLAVSDLAHLAGRLARRALGAVGTRAATAAEAAPAAETAPVAATATAAATAPVAATATAAATAPAPAPAVPRRVFLAQGAAGVAFLAGGGSSLYGALVGRHDYIIEEVAVPIPGLPRSLDGFTIVQLSDIHFGLFIGEPEIHVAEELVRKARGDLVVLTGDLVDYDPAYADLLGRLARRLGPLTRKGVVAIPGNHDYTTGIDVTLGALRRGGATVLKNSGQVVGDAGGGFALLGVDDVWAARRRIPGGGPDLGRALADVPPDLPRVLLCHNPSYFPEAAGEVALQLSGHTHGGQVNPGGVRPADWVLPHGYVAGLYERSGSRLYVNRGFGTAGPPARVGAPPEVTRVVLVSA